MRRFLIRPRYVLLLLVLVVGAVVLRMRNNDYGLPYVYNVDEGSHFTNRAVEMFGGDPNPGYFQNPSGFTYLVHAGAVGLRPTSTTWCSSSRWTPPRST